MKNVEWRKGVPFRAAPAPGPDAFGIVIRPAGSGGGKAHEAPAPRLPLRALLAQAGNRE
jgi:hypothetical protein